MAAMPDAGGPHSSASPSSASPSSASPSSASPSSDANEEPAGLAGRDPNYEDSDGDDSDSDSGEDEDEDEDERSIMKDLGLLSSDDDDDDDEAQHDKANDEAEHDKADVRRSTAARATERRLVSRLQGRPARPIRDTERVQAMAQRPIV